MVFPICHRVTYCWKAVPGMLAMSAAKVAPVRSTTFMVTVSVLPDRLNWLERKSSEVWLVPVTAPLVTENSASAEGSV